ncbi:MAG TPA: hypothetical protein VFH04_03435, partial [Nitrososphaeraceae archaeon]|nr:hypothetical protein [Nitrososphaeraceae archaeon]
KGDSIKAGLIIKRKTVWKCGGADMTKPDPKQLTKLIILRKLDNLRINMILRHCHLLSKVYFYQF